MSPSESTISAFLMRGAFRSRGFAAPANGRATNSDPASADTSRIRPNLMTTPPFGTFRPEADERDGRVRYASIWRLFVVWISTQRRGILFSGRSFQHFPFGDARFVFTESREALRVGS